jgi:hypothetical protein
LLAFDDSSEVRIVKEEKGKGRPLTVDRCDSFLTKFLCAKQKEHPRRRRGSSRHHYYFHLLAMHNTMHN